MALEWLKATADYLSVKDKTRTQDRIRHGQLNTVLTFMCLAILSGVIAVIVAGIRAHYYISAALLWSGAFFVTGWIVGFLFGIDGVPRVVRG